MLLVALIGSYMWYSKNEPFTHGGSKMGIIYGIISLFLMLLLVFFGVRKRWYRSSWGKVENWLQSHIYLGILSLLVILAHTGFRFQDRIAIALFIVITTVIVSGIFGSILYVTVPRMLTEVESNLTAVEISDNLNQLSKTMARISSNKSPTFQKIYQGLMADSTPKALAGWRLILGGGRKRILDKKGEWTQLVGLVQKEEQDELRQLLVVSRQHKELHLRLLMQQKYRNVLQFWLFMHLPLSIAMLVLIFAHIFGVFYYGKISFH